MKSIFVSSTFKDMQAERDMLTYDVLPEITEFARNYGEAISFIDLRWGVDTDKLESDEGAHKVLSVCLDEIERSRPYMIVFLGERYGWIPNKRIVTKAIESKAGQGFMPSDMKDLEKSVTALEIEYGALIKSCQKRPLLILFPQAAAVCRNGRRAQSEFFR